MVYNRNRYCDFKVCHIRIAKNTIFALQYRVLYSHTRFPLRKDGKSLEEKPFFPSFITRMYVVIVALIAENYDARPVSCIQVTTTTVCFFLF